MTAAMEKRWTGHCPSCDREGVEVEQRQSHHTRVLCDRCAAKPFTISVSGLDAGPTQNGRRSRSENAKEEASVPEEAQEPLEAIQTALGLDEPIELITRPFIHDDAPITMVMRDGTSIRWEHTRDLFEPKTLFRPFAMRGVKRPDDLKKADRAWDIATKICAAAGVFIEHDEQEEARGWGIAHLERDAVDADVENHRYEALREFKSIGGDGDLNPHTVPFMRCTETGDRYVRRGLFARWLRETYRVQLSTAAIAGRMSEVGWQAVRLQAWPPGVTYSNREGHIPIGLEMWRVPKDWEELA